MRHRSAAAALLASILGGAAAGEGPCGVELPESVYPGALVIGRISPAGSVEFDGKRLRLTFDGAFVFGVGPEARGSAALAVADGRGCRATARLPLKPRRYAEERVSGLPPQTVTPDPAQAARIAREAARIARARDTDSAREEWRAEFRWPARGRISGVYGSRRILDGQPRAPHLGLDIAAPAGTPVQAPAAGRVSLRDDDMLLTGKTLMLDHGHGVSTLYIHLSAIDVREGEEVTAGQRLGAIGMTGRASGPHLHWGLHWYQVKLDPGLLLAAEPMTAQPR